MTRDYYARKLQHARMVEARQLTRHQLDVIDRQIRAAAIADAASRSGRKSVRLYFGHSINTRWGNRDRERYGEALERIEQERAREIGALRGRLERQDAALAQFRARWGINEPLPWERLDEVAA